MNILQIVGVITLIIIVPKALYKLYRHLFGYSYNSCPIDHDTIARYGADNCPKCNSEL